MRSHQASLSVTAWQSEQQHVQSSRPPRVCGSGVLAQCNATHNVQQPVMLLVVVPTAMGHAWKWAQGQLM
jgi:hypothetical protein